MKVEQGQIWELNKDMLVSPFDLIHLGDVRYRQTLLKKGEKIEIRFPYAWHIRTEDNMFFEVDEETILNSCFLFGTVKHDIFFENKATLEEILRLKLYDKTKK